MRALVSLSNPRSANAMFRAGNPPISSMKLLTGERNPRVSLAIYFAFNAERYLQEGGKLNFQLRKRLETIPSIPSDNPIDFETSSTAEFSIRELESDSSVLFETEILPPPDLTARRNHESKKISYKEGADRTIGENSTITSSVMRDAIIFNNVDPAKMRLYGNKFVDSNGNVTRVTRQFSNQSPLEYDIHYVDSGRSYTSETYVISGSVYHSHVIRNIECSLTEFSENVIYEFSYTNQDDIAEFLEIDISPYVEQLITAARITEPQYSVSARYYSKTFNLFSSVSSIDNSWNSSPFIAVFPSSLPTTPNPALYRQVKLTLDGNASQNDSVGEIKFATKGTPVMSNKTTEYVPFYVDEGTATVKIPNIPYRTKRVSLYAKFSGAPVLIASSSVSQFSGESLSIPIPPNALLADRNDYTLSLRLQDVQGSATRVSSNDVTYRNFRNLARGYILIPSFSGSFLTTDNKVVNVFDVEIGKENGVPNQFTAEGLSVDVSTVSLGKLISPQQKFTGVVFEASGSSTSGKKIIKLVDKELSQSDRIGGKAYTFSLRDEGVTPNELGIRSTLLIEGNQPETGKITKLSVTPLPGRYNSIKWEFTGDRSKVDHFQVYGEYLGIEKLLGCAFVSDSWPDNQLYDKRGEIRYRVRPVFNDFTLGEPIDTGRIEINHTPTSILANGFVPGSSILRNTLEVTSPAPDAENENLPRIELSQSTREFSLDSSQIGTTIDSSTATVGSSDILSNRPAGSSALGTTSQIDPGRVLSRTQIDPGRVLSRTDSGTMVKSSPIVTPGVVSQIQKSAFPIGENVPNMSTRSTRTIRGSTSKAKIDDILARTLGNSGEFTSGEVSRTSTSGRGSI